MKRDLFALRALAFATAVVTVVSLSAGSAVADNWDIDPCETDLTVGSVADGMCTIVVADASHTEGELFVTPAGVTRLWLTIKTGDGEGTDNGTVQVAGGKGVTMMVTIPMAAGEELGLTVGNPSTEVSCPDGDPAAAAGGMALYVSDGSRTTNGYRGWIPGGGGAGCSDSAVAGGKGGDAPVWDGDPNNAIVMGGAGEAGQGASPGGGGQTGNYTGGAHGAPAGNDGYIGEGGEPLAGAVPGGGGSDGCWGAGSGGTTIAGSGGGGGGAGSMQIEADTFVFARAGGMPSGSAQITIQYPMPQGPPRHLSAAAGNAQVILTWEAPDYPVAYQVRYRTGTTRWSRARNIGSEATTYTWSRLKNGRTYSFSVRSGSTGAWSAIATATPQAPPSAVQGLTRVATVAKNGKGQIVVTWNTPARGAKPSGYRINWSASGTLPNKAKLVTATRVTIAGLTIGQRYTISVTPLSTYGTGRPLRVTALVPKR